MLRLAESVPLTDHTGPQSTHTPLALWASCSFFGQECLTPAHHTAPRPLSSFGSSDWEERPPWHTPHARPELGLEHETGTPHKEISDDLGFVLVLFCNAFKIQLCTWHNCF